MNKHDEGDPDNSVLIRGTDEIQLLISSSSLFIYFFSFVIRGRRMKTFSTVAARMLPADDKWYAAVDPEDTDEWCINPTPRLPPLLIST